jgi:hypothetical protein
MMNRNVQSPFLIKLLNWEYWSANAFYWPMFIYGPLLALRARHACFFTAANPGIKSGGLGVESKYETIIKIPDTYRPATVFIKAGTSFEQVLTAIKEADIDFPLIAKPDIGFRGLLVKKIKQEEALKEYLEKYDIDFLIQEYIDYPAEVGVLYYRLPDQESGCITSVTLKEFLHVTGDGSSTVLELVRENPRALLQEERIKKHYADLIDQVPAEGEKVSLGAVGNHCKGTRFINGNHLIDEQLIRTFDEIGRQIPGFNYGRYDIRCASFEALRQGKDFKILEVNGVCSEPTHIYDPDHISYFGALKAIIKHWSLVRKISSANHRLGVPYTSFSSIFRDVMHLKAYGKRIEDISREGD